MINNLAQQRYLLLLKTQKKQKSDVRFIIPI